MKTFNNLYPQIYEFKTLYDAYTKARKGKRHQSEVQVFERNLEGELIQLQNELIWDSFVTGAYRCLEIQEPKKRLAAALPFRDRVVQHAIISVIEPIFEERFIYHSYACRAGKGMHAGSQQLQSWMRGMHNQHGVVYVLKADVAAYFRSIDHRILKEIIKRKICCKRTLKLLFGIIDSWPDGLPIGNLTSQLLANVYLHELDMYCKQRLRIKRYVRYMDDFVIVHHDKTYLHEMRKEIEFFLWSELRLKLNNKTQVFKVEQRGVDFLGYKTWLWHKKIRKDSIKRMRARMRRFAKLYSRGEITFDDIRPSIKSWVAHARHANAERTITSTISSVVFKPSR